MDTPGIKEYLYLEKLLLQIRKEHNDQESVEEDLHLDKMDEVWDRLTTEECDYLTFERLQ